MVRSTGWLVGGPGGIVALMLAAGLSANQANAQVVAQVCVEDQYGRVVCGRQVNPNRADPNRDAPRYQNPPPERDYGPPPSRELAAPPPRDRVPPNRDYGPPAERDYGPPPGRESAAPPPRRDFPPPLAVTIGRRRSANMDRRPAAKPCPRRRPNAIRAATRGNSPARIRTMARDFSGRCADRMESRSVRATSPFRTASASRISGDSSAAGLISQPRIDLWFCAKHGGYRRFATPTAAASHSLPMYAQS